MPIHARPILQSLASGSFEKLSFLAGSLRSILHKPAQVSRWLRTSSLLVNPMFVPSFAIVATTFHLGSRNGSLPEDTSILSFISSLVIFHAVILLILQGVFRCNPGHYLFGFSAMDANGEPASRQRLVARWFVAWGLPVAVLGWMLVTDSKNPGMTGSLALIPWFAGLALTIMRPDRGPHDRLVGSWLVNR